MNRNPKSALSSMITQAMDDIKAKHSKPANPPPAPVAGNAQENVVKKSVSKKPAEKAKTKVSKKTSAKRDGYFTLVGKALKGVKGKVSVKKVSESVHKALPDRPASFYARIVLRTAAWCARRKVACATLIMDHKPVKVEKKAGKKSNPSLKDLGL